MQQKNDPRTVPSTVSKKKKEEEVVEEEEEEEKREGRSVSTTSTKRNGIKGTEQSGEKRKANDRIASLFFSSKR